MQLAQDLRYALRQLRRAPGFAVTAMLTLALGIGATTAVFSVVEQMLLTQLPYRDADRIVALRTYSAKRHHLSPSAVGGDSQDMRSETTFAAIAYYDPAEMSTVILLVREIGIRIALGADRGTVAREVMRSATRSGLLGIVLGVLLSVRTARVLARFLVVVIASDPLIYGTAAAVLLGTAAVTALLPARRAASVDPMVALRTE